MLKGSNLKRHASLCSICNHPQREEIEERFLSWGRSPGQLEEEFEGVGHSAVHRHAKALGLYERRLQNLGSVAEKVIERWLSTNPEVTTTNALDALWKIAKMRGMVVDLSKDLTASFDGRSDAEIAHYAEHGSWPAPGELEALEALDDDPTVQ